MDADGTSPTRLTNDLAIDMAPAWAPGSVGPSVAATTGGPGKSAPTEPDGASGLELVGSALTESRESPLAGVYVHGNYAFVGSQSIRYGKPYPESTEGGRLVSILKWPEGAPLNLG